MMYEQLTYEACMVLHLATQEAMSENASYVITSHILKHLVKQAIEDGGRGLIVFRVLNDISCYDCKSSLNLLGKILEQLNMTNTTSESRSGTGQINATKITLSKHASKVVKFAIEESKLLGKNYVGLEHLLIGLTRDDGPCAGAILANLGVTTNKVITKIAYLYSQISLPSLHEGNADAVQPDVHNVTTSAPKATSVCNVCGLTRSSDIFYSVHENGNRLTSLCAHCYAAGIEWAAKQAVSAQKPDEMTASVETAKSGNNLDTPGGFKIGDRVMIKSSCFDYLFPSQFKMDYLTVVGFTPRRHVLCQYQITDTIYEGVFAPEQIELIR